MSELITLSVPKQAEWLMALGVDLGEIVRDAYGEINKLSSLAPETYDAIAFQTNCTATTRFITAALQRRLSETESSFCAYPESHVIKPAVVPIMSGFRRYYWGRVHSYPVLVPRHQTYPSWTDMVIDASYQQQLTLEIAKTSPHARVGTRQQMVSLMEAYAFKSYAAQYYEPDTYDAELSRRFADEYDLKTWCQLQEAS